METKTEPRWYGYNTNYYKDGIWIGNVTSIGEGNANNLKDLAEIFRHYADNIAIGDRDWERDAEQAEQWFKDSANGDH